MKPLYLLIFIAFLNVSCNSVKRSQKLLAKGDYDQAISLAAKKLQKDKSAKEYDSHIQIMEDAFAKAKEENLRRIALLKREKTLQNAKEIYYTYLDLEARQKLIRPLLPLYSREMRRNAQFQFSDFSSELVNAKNDYVKSLYEEADFYMKRNNKLDFRSAYHVLCELEEIQPHYEDVSKLKQEAHFHGTDFVLVEVNNHTNQFIPLRLQRDLLDFNTYDLNDMWTEFHSKKDNGIHYDYGIKLNFETIQISPERISESQYTRKKTIKDGYEYKRDRRGNIVKDSLGNPIKVEKFRDVTALVTTTVQEKQVLVSGTVVYNDIKNKRTLNNFPLATEFVFSNIFAVYSGDDRALTPEDRNFFSNRFLPFPNNEQMVFNAGTDIKNRLKEIVRDNSFN